MALEPGEELLWKFAKHECSEEESAFVEQWISSSSDNQKKFERIKMYVSMNDPIQEKPNELKEEEKPDYKNYVLAIFILLFVFCLLGVYSIIKSK